MAMIKDPMKVHFNAVDKEIWLFLWHNIFKMITGIMTDTT